MQKFINKITFGDFYELQKQIPDSSVDLIVTDPPYRINARSGGGIADKRDWLKNICESDLDEFDPVEFLEIAQRVLKKFNAYIFCSKNLLVDYINFAVSNEYNWDLLVMGKRNPVPTKNNKYLSDIEYLMFIREKCACFNNLTGKENFRKYLKVKMTNVKASEFGHPTEKPLHVIEPLIEISSQKGDVVFDPFLGTGTTVVACKYLSRKFIGFEIKEEFYKMAEKKTKGEFGRLKRNQKSFDFGK